MNLARVFRPLAVAAGFAEADEDAGAEEFYREEAEQCPHCRLNPSEGWQNSALYFLLGIALSICLHSAQI
jgi:hypothetical protein